MSIGGHQNMSSSSENSSKIVQEALQAVEKFKTGDRPSKRSKWIGGAVAALLSLLALGLLFWKLWQGSKQAAKIAHDYDKLLEKEAQAIVDAQVTENKKAQEELIKRADSLGDEIKRVEVEMLSIREQRLATQRKIKALKSWNEIDLYMANK